MVKAVKICSAIVAVLMVAIIVTLLYNPPCFGLGCTGGYSFQDTVLYNLPKSSMVAEVYSQGFVPDGHDAGDGRGVVLIQFTNQYSTDTIQLITSPENIDTIICQGKTFPFYCSQMNRDAFYYFLDSLGYNALDKEEVTELRDAVTLINYGHKIGYVKGQTKWIEIVDEKRHYNNE